MFNDRAVLHSASHQVLTVPVEKQSGLNCTVVGLRPAAGEDDLGRFASQQIRDLLSCEVYCFRRPFTERIRTRRIPVLILQERQHLLQNLGIDLSRGVIVEVNHKTALPGRDLRILRRRRLVFPTLVSEYFSPFQVEVSDIERQRR